MKKLFILTLAIAAYEKAVAVDKAQSNAVARIKALRAGG